MDSLTHIVLGAATGEVVLGKKFGNKAMFWGAVGGSLPDLDVIVSPFIEPVQSLFFHRGPSHSILFAIVAAPILGWVISRIHSIGTIFQWAWLILWATLIHSAIDCFNTYGTALLLPFDGVRLAFDSIGIIDLLLLIPILAIMLIALVKPQFSVIRKKLSVAVLAYSLIFIILSISNKLHIEKKIKEELNDKGIVFTRLKTAPLPLTNFLWLVLVEDSLGFHFGYTSNFDRTGIELNYLPRNESLLIQYANDERIINLKKFTDNYYSIDQKADGSLWLHDLRFGSMAFEDLEKWFVFSFEIIGRTDSPEISRASPNRSFGGKNLISYWQRLFRDIEN